MKQEQPEAIEAATSIPRVDPTAQRTEVGVKEEQPDAAGAATSIPCVKEEPEEEKKVFAVHVCSVAHAWYQLADDLHIVALALASPGWFARASSPGTTPPRRVEESQGQ